MRGGVKLLLLLLQFTLLIELIMFYFFLELLRIDGL
jgi:hypothetical protein